MPPVLIRATHSTRTSRSLAPESPGSRIARLRTLSKFGQKAFSRLPMSKEDDRSPPRKRPKAEEDGKKAQAHTEIAPSTDAGSSEDIENIGQEPRSPSQEISEDTEYLSELYSRSAPKLITEAGPSEGARMLSTGEIEDVRKLIELVRKLSEDYHDARMLSTGEIELVRKLSEDYNKQLFETPHDRKGLTDRVPSEAGSSGAVRAVLGSSSQKVATDVVDSNNGIGLGRPTLGESEQVPAAIETEARTDEQHLVEEPVRGRVAEQGSPLRPEEEEVGRKRKG